jgi:hypothetical protein
MNQDKQPAFRQKHFLFPVLILCVSLFLSGCFIFKKKCDCPPVGQYGQPAAPLGKASS